jgi:hypothetical protein
MAKRKGKQRCFVVMGFGKKTDYATGRQLDLDRSYELLIKPVVTEKGITCIRADEIKHAGVIDSVMYQELLTADVVIADLVLIRKIGDKRRKIQAQSVKGMRINSDPYAY